jgi:hypothetical protein
MRNGRAPPTARGNASSRGNGGGNGRSGGDASGSLRRVGGAGRHRCSGVVKLGEDLTVGPDCFVDALLRGDGSRAGWDDGAV